MLVRVLAPPTFLRPSRDLRKRDGVARVAVPSRRGGPLLAAREPSRSLHPQAVEGDHGRCPPPPVVNEQPVLLLAQWLPALPTAELRLFLAQRLRRLCDSCPASRRTCVQAGLVGHLLRTLSAGGTLGTHCQEQLLALLQALGRVSLRPSELRCLLRPPPALDSGCAGTEARKARHAGAVLRALSGMARRQGPARALHYFDLTPSMAGIMVPPVQRWPGPGFTFHAWLCLHPAAAAPGPAPSRPPQRKQLYR